MGESESACQMVYELADFYRIGVSKGADFITLEEEIRHVTAYLSILQTRFEDFHFQIEVPEELAGTYVPKIILQPLAENAGLSWYSQRKWGWKHSYNREKRGRRFISGDFR